jgi:hypothetical protein
MTPRMTKEAKQLFSAWAIVMLFSFTFIAAGAGIVWGVGAALIAGGTLMALLAAIVVSLVVEL